MMRVSGVHTGIHLANSLPSVFLDIQLVGSLRRSLFVKQNCSREPTFRVTAFLS
jgi:hypothetical protein